MIGMVLVSCAGLRPLMSFLSRSLDSGLIGVSLSEPHTSKSFVSSTIHKKLWIKIGELTNAPVCVITTSIFARVMVHDTVKLTA